MEEVPEEEQAAMAIKLSDNVRKLIRDELKLALQDYEFLGGMDPHYLIDRIATGMAWHTGMRSEILRIIQAKLYP